jgi:hypothetical protein
LPVISKNFGSETVNYFNVELAPGELLMHPYQGASTFAVIRWTAPSAGMADISGLFYSVTTDGMNTNTHIVFNGVSLFDGNVSGTKSNSTNAEFSLLQQVAAGDTVDLVVGPNAGFGGSTGTSAIISLSAVPEPSTMSLAFVSVGLLFARRLRRQHAREVRVAL